MAEAIGSDQRFESIYESHGAAVAAYCRRRVAGDVVDDMVAEVFMVAWRRFAEIAEGSELPWLYGVARNVVANQRRSVGRRSRLAVRASSQPVATAPESATAVLAGNPLVLAALATLSSSHQEILRLRAWEDLSSAKIAVVLDISAAAVDMRLSRAKRRFERALNGAGFTARRTGARLGTEELS